MTIGRPIDLGNSAAGIAGATALPRIKESLDGLWDRVAITLTGVGGSASAVTATCSPAPEVLAEGQAYWLTPAQNLAAGAKLAIGALSARPIADAAGTAIGDGALPAGLRTLLVYDGSSFRACLTTGVSAAAAAASAATATTQAAAAAAAASSAANALALAQTYGPAGLAPIAQVSGYADMAAAFSLVNCTMADNGDGIARFSSVAASGIAMWTLPSISGKRARYAAVRYKRISGAHRGTIFYTTAAHTWSYSYYATWTDPGTGWSTVVYDMWALNGAGGTDWHDSLITGLRMDISNDATAVFDVEWMAVFGDLPSVPRTAPTLDNTARVANSGTTDAVVEIEQTVSGGSTGALLRLRKAGSTLLALSAYAASGVFEDIAAGLWRIWRVGGVNRMVLTSGGSLGLGTAGATSPTTKLHVSEVAAGSAQTITIENGSTSASSAAALTVKTGTTGATATLQVAEDGSGAPTASWSLGSAIVSAIMSLANAAATFAWSIGGTVRATLSASALTLAAGVRYVGDGSGLTHTPMWDVVCQEQRSSGTASGASAAGSWNVTSLNTLVKNTIGASLSGGILTISPGTYDVEFFSICFGAVGLSRARLYDPTNSVVLALGSSNGSTTGSLHTVSIGKATLVLTAATAIRMDHYTTATVSTNGLGAAVSQGTEIYRGLNLKQVA